MPNGFCLHHSDSPGKGRSRMNEERLKGCKRVCSFEESEAAIRRVYRQRKRKDERKGWRSEGQRHGGEFGEGFGGGKLVLSIEGTASTGGGGGLAPEAFVLNLTRGS